MARLDNKSEMGWWGRLLRGVRYWICYAAVATGFIKPEESDPYGEEDE